MRQRQGGESGHSRLWGALLGLRGGRSSLVARGGGWDSEHFTQDRKCQLLELMNDGVLVRITGEG